MDTRVALRFRVEWAGHVLAGIIVEISSGNPTFDQRVSSALKQWLFSKLPPEKANEIQEGVITFIFRGE
ncbi:MAG: energy transducer TonB [Elusimicrobia bacterium]|nr:energy transducer TonB [Candidatus Obscuribacterium magneticum]